MPRRSRSPLRHRIRVLAAATTLVLTAGACGSDDAGSAGGSDRIQIQASFYPLQWVTEQVGGDQVDVSNLTQAGAEPHDLELTPQDVASLSTTDVVVYLSGFQPAVDDAISGAQGPAMFDAAEAADLAGDPHFWLDPTRLSAVGTAVGETLAERDPENAETYRAHAEELAGQLDDLDGEFEQGLADCASRDLVTSHEAFGYLADRYGLEQVGIAGLSPDQEPSGADLADVTRFVEDHDVRTIYFETLVSPEVAATVADEAGVDTAVLDPLEGLIDNTQDYLGVMRSNLDNLRAGQDCT